MQSFYLVASTGSMASNLMQSTRPRSVIAQSGIEVIDKKSSWPMTLAVTAWPSEKTRVAGRFHAMTEAELAGLVARSLTGEDALPSTSPGSGATRPPQIAEALVAAGWSSERIAAVREASSQAGRPWPLPVPAPLRGSVGAAQLLTASRAVAEQLGVGAEVRLRDSSVPLSPRDRALLTERPPHHGNVG